MVWLAAILVVAWLLGWGVFHVAGGLIHILLVVALVVFLLNFFNDGAPSDNRGARGVRAPVVRSPPVHYFLEHLSPSAFSPSRPL